MEQIYERFSATELDNVLHAINKYEHGDGFTPDEIQTSIWLDGKIAPPIDDAIEAIVHYKDDLVAITKPGKMSKRYKPGPYLGKFLYYGGFKGIYEQQVNDNKRNIADRKTTHQVTIDAAASAKRSADASEISAGAAARSASAADRSANLAKQALAISIIAALLSMAALVKSFFC